MTVQFIDQYRQEIGARPICRTLIAAGTQIAPSTSYAFRTLPPLDAGNRDRELLVQIRRVHERNFGVYAKKIRAQLRRVGVRFARRIVERLVREEGLRGIRRKKGSGNALPDDGPSTRLYLVERDFTEKVANQLRVADITCSRAFAGWICAALVIDLFSRRAVGWQLSKSLRTALALYALQMGSWSREYAGRDVFGLTHNSDEGVHHVATRYTQRLAEAGAVASVGSTGDSYAYALAEVFDSLLKAELVRNCGPWRSIDELEIATAEYIDWFIHRWLHGEIGMIPPVELEDTHLHYQAVPAAADAALASLKQTRGDSPCISVVVAQVPAGPLGSKVKGLRYSGLFLEVLSFIVDSITCQEAPARHS